MGKPIRDSSGNILRVADGVLLFNPYRTFYVSHDWEISEWRHTYRVETPITLGVKSGYAGYATNASIGWQDAPGGIYQPFVYCRYYVNIWLHLEAGELIWKGTFGAFQNRSGTGTVTAQISKTASGYLNPLGAWQVDSVTSSGSGITQGSTIIVTE